MIFLLNRIFHLKTLELLVTERRLYLHLYWFRRLHDCTIIRTSACVHVTRILHLSERQSLQI